MTVIALRGCIPPGEPNTEMVEELERLLELAKTGDMRGFAYTMVNLDGAVSDAWIGSDGSRHSLAAGIALLFHRHMASAMCAHE